MQNARLVDKWLNISLTTLDIISIFVIEVKGNFLMCCVGTFIRGYVVM